MYCVYIDICIHSIDVHLYSGYICTRGVQGWYDGEGDTQVHMYMYVWVCVHINILFIRGGHIYVHIYI